MGQPQCRKRHAWGQLQGVLGQLAVADRSAGSSCALRAALVFSASAGTALSACVIPAEEWPHLGDGGDELPAETAPWSVEDESGPSADSGEAESEESASDETQQTCNATKELPGVVPVRVMEDFRWVGADDHDADCRADRRGTEQIYTWQAPRDGRYRILAHGIPPADPLIYLLNDDCSGVRSSYCSDDHFAEGYDAALDLDVGRLEQVRIAVELFDESTGVPLDGEFMLSVEEALSCDLLDEDGAATGTTKGGSKQLGSGVRCGFHDGSERAYTWSPPESGVYTFEVEAITSFDHSLYLLDGSCRGQPIVCADERGKGIVRVTRPVAAGEVVTAVIDSADVEMGGGKYNLSVARAQCPRVTAQELGSSLPIAYEGTLDEADDHHFSPTCSNAETTFTRDMSHAWRAPEAGRYTISTFGSEVDTILYVLDGSCSGRELDCNVGVTQDARDAEVKIDVDEDELDMIIVVEAEVEGAGELGYKLQIAQEPL